MNQINLKNITSKNIYQLSDKFYGKSASGEELSFTNYFMQMNGKPFFGISGEFHYARVDENEWEDELIKMKMCGINIISTYIFWIHHEEEEGKFRFDGRRDLRKFIELCKKHELYVIVRIGPFDHGEVRNGGIPDWMFGKPFEVRSLSEGFLSYTKRLFNRLGEEMKGLYYKENGPIIAAQIDNEYMHSSAPWEITTGISNEWITGGTDGNAYMIKLKEIAREAGIIVPFYTCTGWGGAMAPTEEILPLWGGYAFWPWIFYSHKGEHPATPEYIYRDNHNNAVPQTYNFDPTYVPETMPYACCEMGGGMMCSYNYRFILPYESVDAMANIKLGSGCNFIGYYMFKGGTNPIGEKTPFLNEGQVTKMSYDYQAALGEFGQIRPSYRRLKALHMFINSYSDKLCFMKTILPEGCTEIEPEDTVKLRYAVRIKENEGFIFINNYQDHVNTQDKHGETIELALDRETITIPDIDIAKDETAILPFNMNVGGYLLKYALAQPLNVIRYENKQYYFFFAPKGMKPVFVFESKSIYMINGQNINSDDTYVKYELGTDETTSITVSGTHGDVEIVVLSREDSLNCYHVNVNGQDTIILSEDTLLYDQKEFRIETMKEKTKILSFPELKLNGNIKEKAISHQLFHEYEVEVQNDKSFDKSLRETIETSLNITQVGPTRFTVDIPKHYMDSVKNVILQVDYLGDVGYAFIDGTMISDNFCNGDVWEIGLREHQELLKTNPITIYINPIKNGVNVNVDSNMAARLEEVEGIIGKVNKVKAKPIYEVSLPIRQ